jgi:hypothetical protein
MIPEFEEFQKPLMTAVMFPALPMGTITTLSRRS